MLEQSLMKIKCRSTPSNIIQQGGITCNMLNSTNRFHVAVQLFSNRLQRMWQGQKLADEAKAECVTDVLTIF